MTDRLPLFPLGAVLFPGMFLPLHIFEPRYRLLVRHCSEREAPFGVVLIRSGAEVGPRAEPHGVGTSAAIVAIESLPDGRSLVVVRGERRFAIERVVADDRPYQVADVRWLAEPDGDGAPAAAAAAREAYGAYLLAVAAATAEQGEDASIAAASDLETLAPGALAYRIAPELTMESADRQRLLEAPDAASRLAMELHVLRNETVLLRDLVVRLRAQGGGPELN